jgi:hypothetical protein
VADSVPASFESSVFFASDSIQGESIVLPSNLDAKTNLQPRLHTPVRDRGAQLGPVALMKCRNFFCNFKPTRDFNNERTSLCHKNDTQIAMSKTGFFVARMSNP